MEAVRFTLKTKKLELAKVPVPKITRPDEVLIKVAYAGICGTDLHIIEGEFTCNPNIPFTMGHELAGTVVDVGSDVNTIKVGDKVSVDPNHGCHLCNFCHAGNPHFCKTGGISDTIGIHKDGGWAEYTLAPVGQVHKIPDAITLEHAVLTEPLSCLAHGWDLVSPVPVGSKILVTGAGIIGNLWVSILHLQGHRNVTVSEPQAGRLNSLRKLDTGYTLITPDQLRRNQQADPDYLFDLVVDCSGYPPAVEHAVSLLQKGGKLCCFGIAPPHGEIKLKPFDLYARELTIFGVNINPFSFPKSIGFVEAMGDRYLNYDKLGIRTYSLKEYPAALEALKKGIISKAVFKP